MIGETSTLDFQLSDELAAHEPPEARGLARDGVRLMVSRVKDDAIRHTRFPHLPDFLAPGDVVVINTSATINTPDSPRVIAPMPGNGMLRAPRRKPSAMPKPIEI